MLLMHTIQRSLIYFILSTLTLLLLACGKKESGQQAPEAMPPMPVSVMSVAQTSAHIATDVVGQTEGAMQVEVRPRVGGIILKKHFEEGMPIKAGQVMFDIDPVPFKLAVEQAQAQLAQQQAHVTQTQRESSRLKGLLDTQSISQREYDNAVSDQAIASASVMQYQAMLSEAQMNLSYTKVKAPTDGIAGRFLFSEGALVAPNTSLLTTIVQASPIWVRFSLSESELKKLGGKINHQQVKNISLITQDGTVYSESGKLNFTSSEIDPALGTQQLRAEFKNADHSLMPGQFARVRISAGSQEGVFLVPQTAVQTGEQGNYVFIANAKNEAERRSVTVGEWLGSDWIILGGLNPGDRVITDNLIKLNMMPPNITVAPHAVGASPLMPAEKTENKK